MFGSSESSVNKSSSKKHEAVDLSTVDTEQKKLALDELSQRSGLKIYASKKRLDYAYTEDYLGQTETCPRCNSATETQYAEFLYATKSLPKSIVAAAGHFCPTCSTVILSEDAVEKALPSEESFQGVIGIKSTPEPITFRAFNDKETHYLRDPQKGLIRMKLLDGTSKLETERDRRRGLSQNAQKQVKKNKRIANQTKKLNRKK